MKNSRLVYTTETGRVCPRCTRPLAACTCKQAKAPLSAAPFPEDGTVRIRRETQGRKGKTVTAVYGLAVVADDLESIATALKRRCGSGGTLKQGVIFIQGDHRSTVCEALQKEGYRVKIAGG